MLVRAVPVLLAGCSAFKFASTLEHVAQLNARNTPRGHSGKFVTVYPDSDEEALWLAAALHEATAGLAGPRILSDRPYAPGSVVHYRYGAFVEERTLSNDGLYSWVIFDPDGNPVEDRRGGTFQPPPWAPRLFPIADCPAGNSAADGKGDDQGVLIGDRFLVREAIRHSNKGGVYRAVDTGTSIDAVLKEARPYVAADDTGHDVRDLLRAEARALEKMEPLGVAPQLLKLFEQSGHVFLAEELVPGVPLRQWVIDEIRNAGWCRHVPGALEMTRRIVELMDTAHQAGLILRDFNPNNIMVRPDGELRLIDLELAVTVEQQDAVTIRVGTPGFSAPEQLEGAPPAVEADYYSLGATLCFVLTGTAPCFLQDQPRSRPLRERLAEWLAVRGEAIDLPAEVHTLILGLMDDQPWKRWSTSAARRVLAVVPQQPSRRQPRPNSSPEPTTGQLTGHQLTGHQWQEAVDGCVNYLLAARNPADRERLWAASCAHGQPDPCILQLGAAGVLGVLTRYFELTGDQRLPEVITTAGQWLARRMEVDAKRPPGLYFGESGIAWSLYEAGRAVGDDRLVEHALAVAGTLPVSAENPDLTQGTAGIGLTFLHLWLRTHDETFAQQAGKAADELIASASEEPSGISWGAPPGSEWRLAGERYHGFAHGTAGVGYFLLAMALATGRPDCLALANRAGETLLANTTLTQGAALWGSRVGDDPTAPYWCHGSAGIATFLTRLHHATGDDRYAKTADLSAQAVIENSWRGVLGQCHGLAGNGDFLLDMADLADPANGQPYEAMAHQLARVIFTHRAYQDNSVIFPDEHGEPCPTWGDGASGVLAFLLRLRYRSPRMWMVDQLLERSHHS
ncbi:MAG: class IV lanthionine synthetase LanL [Pseudonocardiales bacterium]